MALYLSARAWCLLRHIDGCDNDTPLKQVVELCSLLGLQTLTGEEKEPLMCMFVGRKEGSFWRRRQISFRKNLGNPDKLKTTVLWISPAPNPDSGLFGNREESEEESSSAESESEDWEKREGRDANEDGSDASSGDPVEPEGDNWTPVTSRRRGSERLSSPSSIGWSKHIIRVRSNFFNPRSTSLFNKAYSVCLWWRRTCWHQKHSAQIRLWENPANWRTSCNVWTVNTVAMKISKTTSQHHQIVRTHKSLAHWTVSGAAV